MVLLGMIPIFGSIYRRSSRLAELPGGVLTLIRVGGRVWRQKYLPIGGDIFATRAVLFYAFANSGEGFRVADGKLGENFAIQFDAFGLHAVDQLAVADAIFASSVVDASDPECAQIAFAIAAVTVGIA